jgi:uncharacterized protein (UPF0261 family)
MTGAGRAGIPQIVSIGCYDLIDWVGWHPLPPALADKPFHAHNRLISSVVMDGAERRAMAREIMGKLAQAKAEVVFLLPLHGGNEWDRAFGPLSDPEALAAFIDECRSCCPANVRLVELDSHINDPEFSAAALAVVDGWIAAGILPRA